MSLDVKGAFDNISQTYIIKKLYRDLSDDPIRHWIRSFMLNRCIRLKYKDLVSAELGIYEGVPQGSVLPNPMELLDIWHDQTAHDT